MAKKLSAEEIAVILRNNGCDVNTHDKVIIKPKNAQFGISVLGKIDAMVNYFGYVVITGETKKSRKPQQETKDSQPKVKHNKADKTPLKNKKK